MTIGFPLLCFLAVPTVLICGIAGSIGAENANEIFYSTLKLPYRFQSFLKIILCVWFVVYGLFFKPWTIVSNDLIDIRMAFLLLNLAGTYFATILFFFLTEPQQVTERRFDRE